LQPNFVVCKRFFLTASGTFSKKQDKIKLFYYDYFKDELIVLKELDSPSYFKHLTMTTNNNLFASYQDKFLRLDPITQEIIYVYKKEDKIITAKGHLGLNEDKTLIKNYLKSSKKLANTNTIKNQDNYFEAESSLSNCRKIQFYDSNTFVVLYSLKTDSSLKEILYFYKIIDDKVIKIIGSLNDSNSKNTLEFTFCDDNIIPFLNNGKFVFREEFLIYAGSLISRKCIGLNRLNCQKIVKKYEFGLARKKLVNLEPIQQ